MSILIGDHTFEGPVADFADIPVCPGLLALLQKDEAGYMLAYINHCENLARAIKIINPPDQTPVFFYTCPNPIQRKAIHAAIVQEYACLPDCGIAA